MKRNKIKFGDILQFFFDDDTCWGPYGDHSGIVLYDKDFNLRVYLLDKRTIKLRKGKVTNPESYDLECFISNYEDEISIISNIETIVTKEQFEEMSYKVKESK